MSPIWEVVLQHRKIKLGDPMAYKDVCSPQKLKSFSKMIRAKLVDLLGVVVSRNDTVHLLEVGSRVIEINRGGFDIED